MNLFKNQITFTVIILIMAVSSNGTLAQNKDRYEKIRTLKIAYISDQMGFSEEEAERFWPIYNRYDRLKTEQRHETGRFIKSIAPNRDYENISEADAKRLLVYMNTAKEQELKLSQEMSKDIAQLIGYKKTVQLYHIERDFNRKLFKKVKIIKTDSPEIPNEKPEEIPNPL